MGRVSESAVGQGEQVVASLCTSNLDLPRNEIVHLRTAFDILGRHRFGDGWSTTMFMVVRIGTKGFSADERARGDWALRALVQCVENGWLPLVYFPENRRVRYFENSDGPSLHALYPQPTDEEGGVIELTKGEFYPCMVDISNFKQMLRTKFGQKSGRKRGPTRTFNEVDEALNQYFEQNPSSKSNMDVYSELKAEKPTLLWPGKTVRNERINEARHLARMKVPPQI